MAPPSERGRPSSSRANRSGLACSIVPTSVRTMCRRKESAVTVKWRWSPWRSQAASRTMRRKTSCWLSAGVNALKSCSPGSSAAHACEPLGRSTGRGHQSDRLASSAERVDAVEDEVPIRAGGGGEAGVEPLRCLLGREHRDVGRERRVERLRGPVGGRASPDDDARDLPRRVHAGVGATGDGEPLPAAAGRWRREPRAELPRRSAGPAAWPSRGSRRRRTRA